MERLVKDKILEYHPDTLQYVRKTYNLDQPGAMDEAIDILDMWVQKQNHFVKKDYSRDYLERTIIRSKGSVERAKERLDKLCTSRPQIPDFFKEFDVRTSLLKDMEITFLPKLTKDHYRVYFARCVGNNFKSETFDAIYKRVIYMLEYLCAHDYSCGLLLVLDFQQMDLFEYLKHFNIVNMAHLINLMLSGYGFRIKGLHIITNSKLIDSLMAIFKQVFSNKIAGRIQVFRNIEDFYENFDRNILPEEYCGQERSIVNLNQQWMDILDSEDHTIYMKNIKKAITIEELRIKDGIRNEHLGIPGTFRSLNMD
ncbi:unnamed protein product [Diatraea saccharalis]|uniref:CRAL-TRIO domain-containing protein n=1 Tax=Diatraea saccharalis TaxID=40085 RepID=A0A9N9R8Q8_9NEOP|nr:unnamed protein product [Diatraea saccharalis]